jgi:hypothetical protein
LKNDTLNKELTFTIYPNETIGIGIYITDCLIDTNMNFKHYMEFKKGEPLKYSPPFRIDKENVLLSIDQLSAVIRSLVETDLKDVVENYEWITFPTYNPKDDY